MRIANPLLAVRQTRFGSRLPGVAMMAAFLLIAGNLSATTVNWISGGPNPSESGLTAQGAGYVDGDITTEAEYNTPRGVAVDVTGNYVILADQGNNVIRVLEFDDNQTFTLGAYVGINLVTNFCSNPVGVAIDSSDNIFVLNHGNGKNGTVLEIVNATGNLITNAVNLTNANGIALDPSDNIYVTVNSNALLEITSPGVSNVVATVRQPGASLQGLVVKRSGVSAGLIAVCDSARNGIYLINPNTSVVTTNAGFHGQGDFTSAGDTAPSNAVAFFQPTSVTEAGDGTLVVTDFGNNRVKAVLANGSVTNLYGVASNYWTSPYPGFQDGTVEVPDNKLQPGGVANVQARMPYGVAFAPDGSVYVTEDYYHIIRHVTGVGFPPPPPPAPAPPTGLTVTTNSSGIHLTWTASVNATNYNVERATSSGGPYTIIGTTTTTSFTDVNVVPGTPYFYIVSASNAGGVSGNSAEVTVTIPIPPPPPPTIGWYDFEGNTLTGFYSVLHPVSPGNPYVANNPLLIAINPTTNGVSTLYITTPPYTNNTPVATVTNNGHTPPIYEDNQLYGSPNVNPLPQLPLSNGVVTIEAVNVNGVGEPSAIASASFKFQVGTPTILGINAAQFTNTDVTTNIIFYYTLDGTDPTNAPASQQVPSTNGMFVFSLNGTTNIFFQVRAIGSGPDTNYVMSGIAQQDFAPGSFVPNTISFGFASGEASSDFVASPGQTFYAPVTLSILPGTTMYSLQFNMVVTNGPVLGPPLALSTSDFSFTSMLEQPDPTNSAIFLTIPPEGVDQTLTLQNLQFYNLAENLMGVGWLERAGETNLYNTLNQDLIAYSQAHDDTFLQANGKIIVGGLSFPVPNTAVPGQTYQIQIGRPSATSDGIGAPGSDVFIFAPTNGSLGGGSPINALKTVTVGSRGYIAGDCYPFRWFNAGDFGDSNLDNADVEQVFEAACYSLNAPPTASDFLDSMNSCGELGLPVGNYLVPDPFPAVPPSLGSDDTTIDQMVFGDGSGTPNETAFLNLDVNDVYVTLVRSLDPGRTWYYRFWTNDVANGYQGLAAIPVPNVFNPGVVKQSSSTKKIQPAITFTPAPISITNTPAVNFSSTDFLATAGQVLNIPVTAKVFGSYPLRVAMLNISVVPLDGSPPLTVPASFAPNGTNAALGTPYITSAKGNGNYAAAWLNSTITGISNNATIGTLTVTIPTNATKLSSYAIHFDHASGSPNGIVLFPKHALTGLITLSSRTNSYYNDGIPDSWRLRYFGTIYNLLSVSNANADGTPFNNWQKYIAGLDPTDPTSQLAAGSDQPMAKNQQDSVIDWPSVNGKKYIIQRSQALFPAVWSGVATNTGTGGYMEIHDSPTNKFRFYRVSVQ
jgi:sugar lactone lactonase YvrE